MPKDASIRAFKCPSCGAPLEPEIGTLTMKCSYCGGTVIIPESLRTPAPRSGPTMGEVFDFGLNGVDMNLVVGNAMHLPQAIQLAQQGKIDEAAEMYSKITGMEHADAVKSIQALAAGRAVSLTPGRAGSTVQATSVSYSVRSGQAASAPTSFKPASFSTTASGRSTGGRSCGLVLGILVAVVALIAVLAGGIFLLTGKGLGSIVGPVGFASKALTFGSEGIGPGQLNDSRSIGVDRDGNITVADYSDGRIQRFDPQGKFLSGFSVSPDGKKVYMTGMAVSRSGQIFAVFGGNIHVYNPDGTQVNQLGDDSHHYEDLSVGGDGKLYAIANRETIVRFKPDLSIDLEIPRTFTDATGDMELDSHVAADGLGNMYVVGSFNYYVLKFSPDGKYVNRFGGEASDASSNEPGKFSTPNAIAVDGYGRVYVSDFWDIKVFDSDGAYLRKIDINNGAPFGLVFDGQNDLYTATSDRHVVKYVIQKPGN
jgi:sugar lactone lactonase YvrE